MERGATLPDPVDVDPAALGEDVLAERGIERLPTSLRESLDAFSSCPVLLDAFGQPLVDSIVAVRESELERFDGAEPEEVADAVRWVH
jgi:glutamine synthetase